MTALPIPLPDGYIPLIAEGDSVTAGQILAEPKKGDEEIIEIPHMLNIARDKVKHVLKKKIGDTVEVGDIIAQKKGFLGLDQDTIVSKVSGKVSRYERFTGNLIIQTSHHNRTKKVVSPVDGTVAMCNNDTIVISTPKLVLLGEQGWGGKSKGKLFILDASFAYGKANVLYHLDNHAIGKIIVGKQFSREMLIKGAGLGIKGIICLKIDPEDVAYILKREQLPIVQVDETSMKQLMTWSAALLDGEAKTILALRI